MFFKRHCDILIVDIYYKIIFRIAENLRGGFVGRVCMEIGYQNIENVIIRLLSLQNAI